ncbi:MAG: hypothetical protein R2715_06770 [Ilumatobacteraceae bacterium]
MGAQHALDLRHQTDIGQLGGGEVHVETDPAVGGNRGVDPAQLFQRLVEHLFADIGHQSDRLGQGQELGGTQGASRRMLPSCQCLDGDDLTGDEIVHRLERHPEPAVPDGIGDLADHLLAHEFLAPQVGVEHHVLILATRLAR